MWIKFYILRRKRRKNQLIMNTQRERSSKNSSEDPNELGTIFTRIEENESELIVYKIKPPTEPEIAETINQLSKVLEGTEIGELGACAVAPEGMEENEKEVQLEDRRDEEKEEELSRDQLDEFYFMQVPRIANWDTLNKKIKDVMTKARASRITPEMRARAEAELLTQGLTGSRRNARKGISN